MEITLNNQSYILKEDEPTSVWELVKQKFPESQKGIAVAIGEEVLPREEWESYFLAEDEKVFIFKAIQGG